jgi:hypothetical protein
MVSTRTKPHASLPECQLLPAGQDRAKVTLPLATSPAAWNGDVVIGHHYVLDLETSMYDGHIPHRAHVPALRRLWWSFLHTNTLVWNMERWRQEPTNYHCSKLMVLLWTNFFPDVHVQKHFVSALANNLFPSHEECMRDPAAPWKWSVRYHNSVREALCKPTLAESEALAIWTRTLMTEESYLPRPSTST